jgi:hypothetical protein
VLRGFSGLRNQLRYELIGAQTLEGVTWDVRAFFHHADEAPHVDQIPRLFRVIILRNLFAWLWLVRYARRYDFVLVRHMPFDPFALLFAPLVRNRVTVHHSNEVESMPHVRPGWQGNAAALLEKLTGYVAIRTARGLMAVTDELRSYEMRRCRLDERFPSMVYPNGILPERVVMVEDKRPSDRLVLGFMATQFQDWHGLDLLLDAFIQSCHESAAKEPITLHLMGELLPQKLKQVEVLSKLTGAPTIVLHGHVAAQACREVFAECHVGIGSLAIEREGLKEAATLKVREMLAFGIPIYSGHTDVSIPSSFPFYRHGKVCIADLLAFAEEMRGVSRQEVREAALPLIDKRVSMQKVVSFLNELKLGRA